MRTPLVWSVFRPYFSRPHFQRDSRSFSGNDSSLPAEERESTTLPLDGLLHPLNIIGPGDVPGIPLRVLIAVVALDIAPDSEGT